MRCIKPLSRWIDGKLVYYPCGHCEACTRNRRSEKALRGYLESLSHKDSVFLTLTYSDDNVPLNKQGLMTLSKSQFDNFVKRLRSYLDVPIRVLSSGEYSPSGRPHYHCCFFGVGVNDFIKGTKHHHKNSHGEVLEDFCCWKYGGCELASFDIKTAFYVAKYLVKSDKDKKDYEALNIEPEFIYQSRRPALGKEYALKNKVRLLRDGFIRCKGTKFKIPRYFMDNILDDGSDEYQDLKNRLAVKANDGFGQYIESLNKQFKGSGKHILEMMSEEAKSREKTLSKENK